MTLWLKRHLFSATTTTAGLRGKVANIKVQLLNAQKVTLPKKTEGSAHLSRIAIHHLYIYSTLLYFCFHQDEQHYPFDDLVHNCSLYAGGTAEAHDDPPSIAGTFVTDDASGGEITSNFGKLSFTKVCYRIRVSFFLFADGLAFPFPSVGF
jgi:hypothetical protein